MNNRLSFQEDRWYTGSDIKLRTYLPWHNLYKILNCKITYKRLPDKSRLYSGKGLNEILIEAEHKWFHNHTKYVYLGEIIFENGVASYIKAEQNEQNRTSNS